MSSNCLMVQPGSQASAWKTSLLLHFDEAANSTVLASAEGKTVTAAGTAKVSTVDVVGNGTRSLVNPSGSCLTMNASADFTMGTGDFTMELWILSSAVSSAGVMTLISLGALNQAGSVALAVDASTKKLYLNDGFGNHIFTSNDIVNYSSGIHLAYSRKAGVGYLSIGGNIVASGPDTNNYTWNTCTIGRVQSDNPTRQYIGYLDEVRVTKGLGRYNGNFGPQGILAL